MKRQAKCAKCGAAEIIRIPGTVGAYGSGNNIKLGGIPVRYVLVSRYVCAACGFSEDWVDSAQDIDRLRKKFGVYTPQDE